MANISSDTTLNLNSAAPTNITKVATTAVFVDDDLPTSNLDGGNVRSNTVGTNLSAGTDLIINPGVTFTTPVMILAAGTGTNPGSTVDVRGGTVSYAVLTTPNESSSINDTNRPQVILSDGAQLIMPGTRVQTWAATHFAGSYGYDFENSYAVSDLRGTANQIASNTVFGTTTPTFYFGYNSRFSNHKFYNFQVYEIQDDFREFSNVDLVFTNGTGNAGSSGVILLAAGENIHSNFTGLANITFDGVTKPTSFKYFSINASACSHTFQASIPTDATTWQCVYTGGNTGASNSPFSQYYFQAPITVDGFRINTDGTQATSTGEFALRNSDGVIEVGQTLTSSGNLAANSRYNWWQHNNRAFISSNVGDAGSFVAPIGIPSATTTNSMLHFIPTNTTNFATAAGVLLGSNNSSTISTSVATDSDWFHAARRCYPYRYSLVDWGYYPTTTVVGTEVALTDTDDPTKAEVDAAEASADAVRNGLSLILNVEEDPAITLTEAQALALSGIAHSVNSAGTQLTTTVTTANRTVSDIYQNTAKWVKDNFDNAPVITAPNAPASGGWRPGSVTVSTDNTPGTTQIAFTTDTAFQTVAANGAAWNTINGIITGNYGSGEIRPFRVDNDNAQLMNAGVLLARASSTNWVIFEFSRTRGQTQASNETANVVRIIASAGTLDTSATYTLQSAINEFGLDIDHDLDIPNYLGSVNLRPSESNGTVVTLLNNDLTYSGNGTMGSGDSTFSTIRLNGSDVALNSSALQYSVTATGSNGTVRGFPTNSSISSPAIVSGTSVQANVTLEFAGGSTYFIAGDISSATLTRTGSGNATLIQVGNGSLPSTTPDNFVFSKQVTVALTAPTGTTFDTDNLDSDQIVNIVAYQGTSSYFNQTVTPFTSVPSNALNRGAETYGSGNWLVGELFSSGSINSINFSAFTDWTYLTDPLQLPNLSLSKGIHVSGFTQAQAETIRDWSSSNSQTPVIIYGDADNWCAVDVGEPDFGFSSGNVNVTVLRIIDSAGVPLETSTVIFGVDASGNDVAPAEIVNTRITTPTPTVSNSNRTITYSYEIEADNSLYYAFSAKSSSGQWFETVSGNTTASNTIARDLVAHSTAVIPTAFSSAAGLTALDTWLDSDDAVVANEMTNDSDNPLVINLSNGAVPSATSLDGFRLHRRIQQQTNYLASVAAGSYPLNGWTYGTGQIVYTNENVTWQKQTASNNVIEFATPVIDQSNNGIKNDITTSNVTTNIIWGSQANIGVVPQNTLESALEATDVATNATVWAANVAL